ncbi:MDR family MFS transporter [Sediminibacillus albus]|uniref:Drug resistance transporter, EmrB/QacA subfamily n=1 Tax=Sediminibacillus albus TaxID=407036 RepID=A0A1G9BFS5_9BACI|nr:MDR family MFS transporter [Sediminibacillus albus]SDK38307.1 drug resistance transporter, EmrB/QacA subfamily [Sediminibacillus albus]
MKKIDSKWLVVVSVLFGTFTVILNNSMLNPTLPHFIEFFDANAVSVGWILTIFMVSMGMTMPLTGYLGDRFGKKKIYLVGLAVFLIGSLAGALSQTLGMIIISRAVQGMAGGLMMPIAMALIFQAFPKEERGLAVGVYGVAAMVAPAIGPTIGGVIIEFLPWNFLFLFNIPFGLTGLIISGKYLLSTEPNRERKFDLTGFILVTFGVGAILFALGRGSTWELLTEPLSVMLMAGGLLTVAAFVFYEQRQTQPLLDLSVFKVPTYSVSIVVTAAASIGLFSGIFLLPLLIQNVYGLSEIQTGLLFLPAALCSGLFMTLGGKLLDKKGPRYVVPPGLLLLAVSTFALGNLKLSTPFWLILLLNTVRGAGLGMSNMPATTAGMNAIPEKLVAQGSAMNNVLRQIFSAFGIVFFSIYYEVRRAQLSTTANLAANEAALQTINEAFIISSIVMVIVVPAAFVLKGQHKKTADN